ncbi:MAG: VWA domain-containing protein [Myxococcales bacterium]
MEWLGLSGSGFATALIGLGAAVVALYLLKEQRRRIVVPALALWESLLKSRAQAALSTRLRRVFSLLLALTILLCMLLALADIRRSAPRTGRNLLILVDRSASMGATDEPGTRLAAAKERVRALLAELGPNDHALIASLDQQATPRCTWSNDRQTLREALDAIPPSDIPGDLVTGVRLALDALSGRSSPELHLASDGNLGGETQAKQLLATRPQLQLHYHRVGKSPRNVGITAFAARGYALDQGHLEGMLSLQNFGPRPEEVTLGVSSAGTPLYEERFVLAAGERAFRTLKDLPTSEAPLEAKLVLASGPDALPSDDRAYASLPEQHRIRVLVVSEGNRYLEAALLLEEYLEVAERTPDQYQSAAGFDAVIFDRTRPAHDPEVPALYLGTRETAGFFPLAVQGEINRPFFDQVDTRHPVLKHLSLRDVNLARALSTTPQAGDRVLAETSAHVPLIVEGQRGAPFLALTFDVRESDLPLRAAWPLLVLRSLERLSARGNPASTGRLAGEVLRVSVPEQAPVSLESPFTGARMLQPHGGEVAFMAERTGVYRVRQGALTGTLVANVDAFREGAIAPRSELLGQTEAHTRALPTPALPERSWPWFVGLALALLCLEWLSFHRRWTV